MPSSRSRTAEGGVAVSGQKTGLAPGNLAWPASQRNKRPGKTSAPGRRELEPARAALFTAASATAARRGRPREVRPAQKGPPAGSTPRKPQRSRRQGAGGEGRGPYSVVWEGGASWGQTEGTVHSSVSVSDAPELCAQKQLRWQVLGHVYLATIQVIIKKAEGFTPQ